MAPETIQVTLALPEPLMMSLAFTGLLIFLCQWAYIGMCVFEWLFPGPDWRAEARRNEEIGRMWSQAVWKENFSEGAS
jgi:hypothetical protein